MIAVYFCMMHYLLFSWTFLENTIAESNKIHINNLRNKDMSISPYDILGTYTKQKIKP